MMRQSCVPFAVFSLLHFCETR